MSSALESNCQSETRIQKCGRPSHEYYNKLIVPILSIRCVMDGLCGTQVGDHTQCYGWFMRYTGRGPYAVLWMVYAVHRQGTIRSVMDGLCGTKIGDHTQCYGCFMRYSGRGPYAVLWMVYAVQRQRTDDRRPELPSTSTYDTSGPCYLSLRHVWYVLPKPNRKIPQ